MRRGLAVQRSDRGVSVPMRGPQGLASACVALGVDAAAGVTPGASRRRLMVRRVAGWCLGGVAAVVPGTGAIRDGLLDQREGRER